MSALTNIQHPLDANTCTSVTDRVRIIISSHRHCDCVSGLRVTDLEDSYAVAYDAFVSQHYWSYILLLLKLNDIVQVINTHKSTQ